MDLVDHYIYHMLNDLVSPAITRNWIISQNKQKYIRDLLCTSRPCTRRHVSCNSAHFPHSTTLANESLRIPTTSLSNISNQVINSGKQAIDIGLPHLLLYNCNIARHELLQSISTHPLLCYSYKEDTLQKIWHNYTN